MESDNTSPPRSQYYHSWRKGPPTTSHNSIASEGRHFLSEQLSKIKKFPIIFYHHINIRTVRSKSARFVEESNSLFSDLSVSLLRSEREDVILKWQSA